MRSRSIISNRRILALALITAGLIGCSEDNYSSLSETGGRHPIRLAPVYPAMDVQTRATIDGGFVSGDAMGIFVVDRDDDGQAVEPVLGGGRASNMRFALGEDGAWTGSAQLYWSPTGQAADFYGYYPFNDNLSSVTNCEFFIEPRQDAEDASLSANGYNDSDLLWAKEENVEPTVETITLQYKHLMAGISIRLEMGSGFTAAEWTELEKTVLVKNTALAGTVNLATGGVQVSSEAEPKTIVPLKHNGTWRAVTYPQTVAADKTLVSVTIDGQSYALKKDAAITFLSGKMHNFTITVDRS
ncbi:MAG: fimbrillin family protein, partial [Bacteroidaceae bacterium]|nr:fimbrillin family protein [Bacteroidaceae bacterium]